MEPDETPKYNYEILMAGNHKISVYDTITTPAELQNLILNSMVWEVMRPLPRIINCRYIISFTYTQTN